MKHQQHEIPLREQVIAKQSRKSSSARSITISGSVFNDDADLSFPSDLRFLDFALIERKRIFCTRKKCRKVRNLCFVALIVRNITKKAISWWHDVSKSHSGNLSCVYWRWLKMVFHNVLCFWRISNRHTTSHLLIYFAHSTRRRIKPPARAYDVRKKIAKENSWCR